MLAAMGVKPDCIRRSFFPLLVRHLKAFLPTKFETTWSMYLPRTRVRWKAVKWQSITTTPTRGRSTIVSYARTETPSSMLVFGTLRNSISCTRSSCTRSPCCWTASFADSCYVSWGSLTSLGPLSWFALRMGRISSRWWKLPCKNFPLYLKMFRVVWLESACYDQCMTMGRSMVLNSTHTRGFREQQIGLDH